jgi:hypothetical protein
VCCERNKNTSDACSRMHEREAGRQHTYKLQLTVSGTTWHVDQMDGSSIAKA